MTADVHPAPGLSAHWVPRWFGVAESSAVRAAHAAVGLVLCSCPPPQSCPFLYGRLCPVPAARTSERTWVNPEGRFVRALILIDMLSGDEYYLLQSQSAPSGCLLASFPPPLHLST